MAPRPLARIKEAARAGRTSAPDLEPLPLLPSGPDGVRSQSSRRCKREPPLNSYRLTGGLCLCRPIQPAESLPINWRRGRDSNPRTPFGMLLTFQASAFDHSATSPRGRKGTGGHSSDQIWKLPAQEAPEEQNFEAAEGS